MNSFNVTNIVSIGSALIQFAEMLDDYEARKLEKMASEQAIAGLYSLYKQGKLTKKQFLTALDPILEQGKNITGESDIVDVITKLLG